MKEKPGSYWNTLERCPILIKHVRQEGNGAVCFLGRKNSSQNGENETETHSPNDPQSSGPEDTPGQEVGKVGFPLDPVPEIWPFEDQDSPRSAYDPLP